MKIIEDLRTQINSVFIGKENVVEDVLTCFLAQGHILLEDVPGVGKTTLAKTLSRSMDCSFARIQFTPDTLPSDIVGLSVYNMKTGEFDIRSGAIMHQMILADEINRTSPKTQASLLEAMSEGKVTIDQTTFSLPKPFLVIATQNPVEFLGTYPLPEAQMDRFMMRLSVGYPDAAEEIRLARNFVDDKNAETLEPVCTSDEMLKLCEDVKQIHVSDRVLEYIQNITASTRKEPRFVLGASPRAMLALVAASRARAFLAGRDHVKPDDVKAVTVNVLHHRLNLTGEAKIRKENTDSIITSLMLAVKVPME